MCYLLSASGVYFYIICTFVLITFGSNVARPFHVFIIIIIKLVYILYINTYMYKRLNCIELKTPYCIVLDHIVFSGKVDNVLQVLPRVSNPVYIYTRLGLVYTIKVSVVKVGFE